ncbi:MAG: TetR/AcrR family transcriptional regulator [Rhizobiaceae bacterium]|nr:TetR/AcrR family transcriptional regulator [Rhizobiaceae bacterium]
MAALVESMEPDAVPTLDCGRYCDHLADVYSATDFATKGDRTKFRLKIAAARALEEVGYQDMKVADICAFAEVALGTFYVYFRDKNEIAIEVVLDFVNFLYDRARQVGGRHTEYEAILNTNRFFISAYQRNAGLMQCHVQLQSRLPEFRTLWRPRHRKWIEGLARSITRRGVYGAGMPGSTMMAARALEGMVFHYLYSVIVTRESVLDERELDPDELAKLLTVLWYRAVYCKDPPELAGAAVSG